MLSIYKFSTFSILWFLYILFYPIIWLFNFIGCPCTWFHNYKKIIPKEVHKISKKPKISQRNPNDHTPYFKNRCSTPYKQNQEQKKDMQTTRSPRNSSKFTKDKIKVKEKGDSQTDGSKLSTRASKSEPSVNSDRVFIKHPSLTEIGANPFLNFALLGISSCNKFVQDMMTLRTTYKAGLEKLTILNELILILNGHSSNHSRISNNRIFKKWNKFYEQDSFELMEQVLNQVYNEIRKYKVDKGEMSVSYIQEWPWVPLPMRMVLEYRIRCNCDTPVQVLLQSDLAIHLPIPLKSSKEMNIQTMIDQFFMDDSIEEYNCLKEECTSKNSIRGTRIFKPLPRTLCVHLQRIFWNGYQQDKIKEKIKICKKLIIKPEFCLQNRENYKRNNTKKENQVTILSELENECFDLVSVLVHLGSIYGGHYICYKYANGKWFRIDDLEINEVRDNEVFSCEAYVLFYETIKD